MLISWGVFTQDGRFHEPTLGSEVSGEKLLLPVILEAMEVENSPVVLAAMLATLADLGTEAEVPLISPFLGNGNFRVVNDAVLALHSSPCRPVRRS